MKMPQQIPNAHAQIIPDAGHTSNMENPEAFNACLDAFLGSLLDAKLTLKKIA
jgi:pimeloyl-ACP methyl ester carboxylesterase